MAKLSKSASRVLLFEYFADIIALITGAMGQFAVAMDMFPTHGPKVVPLLSIIFFLPLYAIWLSVFCNQPLLPFQTYIRWCFYMSCCSVGATLLFELFYALGLVPVHYENVFMTGRIMMHLGWLSFLPQIHYWVLYRKNPPSP